MCLDNEDRAARVELPELLTPKEVSSVLRCSLRHVYNLFDRAILLGPKGQPRRIFASSVRHYLEDTNEPAEQAQPLGLAEPAADQTKGKATTVRSFRHLRL
jgi:hypothetical protein